MTAPTYKRVCQVIGTLAGIDPEKIAPGQALGPSPTPNFYWNGETPDPINLDSLDRVTLAMQLEEAFGITITDEEVDDIALNHVGGLVAFVQGRLDAKSAAFAAAFAELGPPLVINASTATPIQSIGFDMFETPTTSSAAPTGDGPLELTEADQLTNCGVLDVRATPDDAKRIFRIAWEARAQYWEDLPDDESEELLAIEWVKFAEAEGLKP